MTDQIAAPADAGAAPSATPELAPTPAIAAPVDGGAPTDDNAAAPAAETPAQPAENEEDKRKASYRFSELSRQLRERDMRIARLEGRLEAGGAAPSPTPAPQAQAPQPPKPTDFEHGEFDPRYIKDLAKFEAKQEIAQEQEERERARTAQTTEQQARDHFVSTYQAIESMGDDFAPALDVLRAVDRPMKDLIVSTENPGYVAAYFANNPQALGELNRLSPHQRALRIGAIDARIGVQLDALKNPAPSPAPAITPTPTPTPRAPGNGPNVTPLNPETMPIGDVEQRLVALREQKRASGW